jgi:hypothetical protein
MPAWMSGLSDFRPLEDLLGPQQRDAAARHDAFLDRGAGGVQRVIDAILALLHLGLGGTADPDDRNAAGELGQPLLQLLAVVVGRGVLDLGLDLVDAALDALLLAGTVDDRGVLLLDAHLAGAAEHVEGHVLELDAEVFRDHLATGQDGDVLEHRLATIAEARRLDGRDLQAAAQLVDDERGKRLALDVLGHDQQRLARLDDLLEHRQHRLEVGQLLLVQQDVGVLELGHHLLGVGDEVRREIAAVELHALDDLELGIEALGLFHRDDALVADLLHGFGDHVADGLLAVGRDGADLGHFSRRLDLLGDLREVGDHGLDGHLDAAAQVHRVHAGGHRLAAFADDRLGQHAGRRGAVAGQVVGLGGDFAHHLGAHVLEPVLELDFLGDGDAVLGGARCAEGLFDDHVAALGAEGHLDGVGENVHAVQQALAGVRGESYVFSSHVAAPSLLE